MELDTLSGNLNLVSMQKRARSFFAPSPFPVSYLYSCSFFMQEKSHRSCERWDSVLLSNVSA